jgi:coenzyme F420-reducing hydrogenase delta subunit
LTESGLEKERIKMVNVGAADARPFADVINDFISIIKQLGPVKPKELVK